MNTAKNPDLPVVEFKWWYRWVGAGGCFLLGGLLLAIGVPALVRLIGDLHTLPPTVTTSNVWPAALALGPAIVGLGFFFLFPPVLVERQRKADGKPPYKGTLLRTKIALGGLLAALLLYPILAIAADSVTSAILERHGYTWSAIDQGHHSRIHEARWARPA